MTRRETIIVAALINLGLLVILFVTAINPKEEPSTLNTNATTVSKTVQEEPTSTKAPETQATSNNDMALIELTVRRGDSIDKIAESHSTSVAELMEINKLRQSELEPGQILRVPAHAKPIQVSYTAPLEQAKTFNPPAAQEEERYYTVSPGDTPWAIAKRNNIKLSDLLRMNNLDEKKARRLRAGDKLRVR